MKTSFLPLLAVASILFVASSAGQAANGARGGAADLLSPVPAHSVAQPAAKTHVHCADCRDSVTTRKIADGKNNAVRTVAVEQHLCGACKDNLQTTGHGKATVSVPVHTCGKTSDKATGCCSK